VFLVFLWFFYSQPASPSVDHWLDLKGKSDTLLFLRLLFDADENVAVAVHYYGDLYDCFDTLSERVYKSLCGRDDGTHECNTVDPYRTVDRPSLGDGNAGIEKDVWWM